jgi:hypothetical protein
LYKAGWNTIEEPYSISTTSLSNDSLDPNQGIIQLRECDRVGSWKVRGPCGIAPS